MYNLNKYKEGFLQGRIFTRKDFNNEGFLQAFFSKKGFLQG